MTRNIFLSIEATGLDPSTDRAIEIVALEALRSRLTGLQFHVLLDPQHPVNVDAELCIGYSNARLAGLPTFRERCSALLKFLNGANLIPINQEFGLRLINAELARLHKPPLAQHAQQLWDVQAEARRRGLNIRLTVDNLATHFGCRAPVQSCSQTWRDCFMLAQIFPHLTGAHGPSNGQI